MYFDFNSIEAGLCNFIPFITLKVINFSDIPNITAIANTAMHNDIFDGTLPFAAG